MRSNAKYGYVNETERRSEYRRSESDLRDSRRHSVGLDRPYTRKKLAAQRAAERERTQREAQPIEKKRTVKKSVHRRNRQPIGKLLKRILVILIALMVVGGIVALICTLSGQTRHAMPSIVLPTPEPTEEPVESENAEPVQLTEDGLPIM